ncbi:MAG TPA: hypothetical protein VFW23_11550 [Tepidisphaeraceae bacterium]|nr:hypothetical protein [Tepidisphaeraceae bacterium]
MGENRVAINSKSVARWLVPLLAALVICGCGKKLTPEERQLVGEWFCKGEDYNFSMFLNKDGTFGQAAFGKVSNPDPDGAKWHVEGDELVILTPQPNGKVFKDSGPYTIEGDKLQWTRKIIKTTISYTRVH